MFFLAFVEQVLAPRLEPGHVVILDNLSAHKVAGIRQLIEDRGAQLLYLPPYSPDFNPIEQAWSKLKQQLRGVKARVLEQLEPAIADALSAIGRHVGDGAEHGSVPCREEPHQKERHFNDAIAFFACSTPALSGLSFRYSS